MFARWKQKFDDALSSKKADEPAAAAAPSPAAAAATPKPTAASKAAKNPDALTVEDVLEGHQQGNSYFIDTDSRKTLHQLLDEIVLATAEVHNERTLNYHKMEKNLQQQLPKLIAEGTHAARVADEFIGPMHDVQFASQSVLDMKQNHAFKRLSANLNDAVDRLSMDLAAIRETRELHQVERQHAAPYDNDEGGSPKLSMGGATCGSSEEGMLDDEDLAQREATDAPLAEDDSPPDEMVQQTQQHRQQQNLPPRPIVPNLGLTTHTTAGASSSQSASARQHALPSMRTPRSARGSAGNLPVMATPRDNTPRWKEASKALEETADPFGDTRPSAQGTVGTPRWKEAQAVNEVDDPFAASAEAQRVQQVVRGTPTKQAAQQTPRRRSSLTPRPTPPSASLPPRTPPSPVALVPNDNNGTTDERGEGEKKTHREEEIDSAEGTASKPPDSDQAVRNDGGKKGKKGKKGKR